MAPLFPFPPRTAHHYKPHEEKDEEWHYGEIGFYRWCMNDQKSAREKSTPGGPGRLPEQLYSEGGILKEQTTLPPPSGANGALSLTRPVLFCLEFPQDGASN